MALSPYPDTLHRAKIRIERNQFELYDTDQPLHLENGRTLAPVSVAYETYGNLNAQGNNAILICHALTGSAHAADLQDQVPGHRTVEETGWWNGAIGPGKAFDPEKYFIICSNILGSCYGTTGPVSINPKNGRPYGINFPQIRVRDLVRVQRKLLDYLGVKKVLSVAGGSLGGMQVLEWAVLYPEFVESIIPIATAARHSAWGIALNEVARMAIMNDPRWNGGNYNQQPVQGLALARMTAMISYRSGPSFEKKFGRKKVNHQQNKIWEELLKNPLSFQVESYLRYQGQKLAERFDANTYILLSRAMDLHDLTTDRASLGEILGSIQAKTLSVGISSDILYPVAEQQQIAQAIPGAVYREIESLHGHDAFLIEYEQLNRMIGEFLAGF
jgi:homoserine O-acetyltransferase